MLQRLSPAAQQLGARFINEPANQNFVRWAAFYLGMTAALHARATVKWLNHEELSAMKPDIPFDFVTSQVALVDSDKLYLPLVAIVAALSRDPQGGDLAAWARTLDESVERRLVPLERPRRPALDLNKHWLTALDLAGYQAAFAMGQARDHGQSSPLLVQGQPDGTTLLQDFSMFGDAQAGLQMIDDAIAHNPDKLPFQISVLDSFVNLPTGRVDAVSVNLVVYGGGLMSGRKPLQLVIACPWRPASAGAGFAIQPPVLQHCAGEIALEALAWAFFKGVDRYKFDDFTWRLHEAPARPDLH